MTIPADYTVECSDEITYDDASATDNCGMVEIGEVMTTIAGDCTGNYTITRAFTATDECGNMTSATQTITVKTRLHLNSLRCQLTTPWNAATTCPWTTRLRLTTVALSK